MRVLTGLPVNAIITYIKYIAAEFNDSKMVNLVGEWIQGVVIGGCRQ